MSKSEKRNIHKRRYLHQKLMAKRRGIEWQLTFDEWMGWWLDSGRYYERGRRRGQYVMARPGDVGPYALDNIVCITHSENSATIFREEGKYRRTHCIRGHLLTEDNIKIKRRKDGVICRQCRICTNRSNREGRLRNKVDVNPSADSH